MDRVFVFSVLGSVAYLWVLSYTFWNLSYGGPYVVLDVYVQEDRAYCYQEWTVTFSQGSWSETVHSGRSREIVTTRSGRFDVRVTANGTDIPAKRLDDFLWVDEECTGLVILSGLDGGCNIRAWQPLVNGLCKSRKSGYDL